MPKRIVICCDGTWNTPDQKDGGKERPTNVVKLARALKPVTSTGTVQVVFYNQGVGTGNILDRILGGAFGAGLSEKILEAYRFLVHNYLPGDDIFLIGFSRGAYTARSLAGLIRNCGILKKEKADLIDDAYNLYRDRSGTTHPSGEQATGFRQSNSFEPRIKFIGVWDTVGALGIPISKLNWFGRNKYDFHDVKLSSMVDFAYHAVAIDEKRKPYEPSLWQCDTEGQVVEQVWFTGVHTNVGGGFSDTALSNIALRWMIDKARPHLEFEDGYLDMLDPNPVTDYKGPIRKNDSWMDIFGTRDRTLGNGAASKEFVHTSAKQRYDEAVSGYHPDNLGKYLSLDECKIC